MNGMEDLMRTERKTSLTNAQAGASDPLAEEARLREAVYRAALELGLADGEARRCGDMNAIEIDSVAVTLLNVRTVLDDAEPDAMGPEWMLMARALDLPHAQPLRSTVTCTLLLHMSMAAQLANGCAVGHDGEEGVHVMRATERGASPQLLAQRMQRVAATVQRVRELPECLAAMASEAVAAVEAAG